MCYNISYRQNNAAKLQERFSHVVNTPKVQLELPTFYFVSGFDFPSLPIVTAKGIELFQWGLIPFWVKDLEAAKKLQINTLNAKGETVFETASFKDCISKQRCLIPVNGFIEWRDLNKVKYPHYITVRSEEIFSLGGIYSNWTDRSTGEIKTTFSVITTAANPMLEKIHNLKKRMPLIIGQEDEKHWINPDLSKSDIEGLIKPYDEKNMQAITISRHVNNSKNERNQPEILNEVKYQELNEAPTLF